MFHQYSVAKQFAFVTASKTAEYDIRGNLVEKMMKLRNTTNSEISFSEKINYFQIKIFDECFLN